MKKIEDTKILVGMSGGIDSSVTAALLKKQGYQVEGVTMKVWGGADSPSGGKHGCYGPGEFEDIEDARKMAVLIGIPFHVIELVEEYKKFVIKYFQTEYLMGRTPNPCIMCNQKVKFGFLLERARESGIEFDYFATGHYARKHTNPDNNRCCVKKGVDPKKDQSYFLSFLSQKQIAETLFPLGDLTKEYVRELAEEFSLPLLERPESQDFIEGGDYSILFEGKPELGPILDIKGRKIGEHKGIINYTVGQRKGLGIAAPEPLFVLKISPKTNSITVGPREYLYTDEIIAGDMNWMLYDNVSSPFKAGAKIRLTHKEVEADIIPMESGKVRVKFSEPVLHAAPGQIVALYDKDLVIGGGVINEIFLEGVQAGSLPC